MANKFIRFEGYWISCTNPELITKFDNLEVALLALKEKHQQGYENYGITKSRGRYELRKYHPEPYGKNPGFQKTNERSHLTITIGNINHGIGMSNSGDGTFITINDNYGDLNTITVNGCGNIVPFLNPF